MNSKNKLKTYHGLIGYVIAIIIIKFSPASFLGNIFGRFYSVAGEILLPLSAFAIVMLNKTSLKDILPFKLPSIRCFFSSVGLMIGTLFLGGSVNIITSQFIPNYAQRESAINDMIVSMSPVAAIFTVALIPAICEEIFCRGFIQASLSSTENKRLMIFIVGISFGILHFDLYALVSTSLIGALFAFITLKTNSLIIPIILHFLNNSMSVFLAYYSKNAENSASQTVSSPSLGQSIIASVFCLSIALVFLFFFGNIFAGKKFCFRFKRK